MFKALADPTRRAILDELAEREEQTLFELCTRLAMRHGLTSTRQAISSTSTCWSRPGSSGSAARDAPCSTRWTRRRSRASSTGGSAAPTHTGGEP